MAIRSEDLERLERVERLERGGYDRAVIAFPTGLVRARAARARRVAVLQRRVGLGFLATFVVAAVLLGGGTGQADLGSRAGAPRAVVLASGETLWDLAGRYGPKDTDPRAYVDAVIELNQLAGAPQAGAKIKLPR
jgi:hypothetical protein